MSSLETAPKLSVVVVCYEMATQIENTLRSLVPPYQQAVALGDYEIILIDHGSRAARGRRLERRVSGQ